MKLEFCGLYCKYLEGLLGQGPRHPLSITWGRETVSCYSHVAYKSPAITALQTEVGFPDSLAGKESTCNAGDPSLIPGLGRPPGGEHGNPPQYSCLVNPHGQRSLENYRPCGHKELDTTERLSTDRSGQAVDTHSCPKVSVQERQPNRLLLLLLLFSPQVMSDCL